MQNCRQARAQTRAGKKTGMWLAMAIAIGLHAIILLLPLSRQMPVAEKNHAQIELQLTTFVPPPLTPQVPAQPPETIPPVFVPEPPKAIAETQADAKPPIATVNLQARDLEHDPDKMSEQAKKQLANSILARQFNSEESETDKLFGKPLEQYNSGSRKEFHYPVRQSMISMLDQPMPEVPFAYTPGLVNFAYDPGVKGELQRFWDVITPEFGWKTKNGTEFKCIWVLIIAGCGWK